MAHLQITTIKQIANENGYNTRWVNKIIHNNLNKKQKQSEPEEKKFVTFTYVNKQTNKIAQIFKNKFKLNIAFRTNNRIGQQLGKHNFNNINKFENSGVYRLTCPEQGCGKNYLGQSGRSFKVRFKEHQQGVKHGRPSAFGTHAFEENHPFNNIEDTLEIVKVIEKGQDLNTYEAIEIFLERNNVNNLNEQETFGNNPLFQCLV